MSEILEFIVRHPTLLDSKFGVDFEQHKQQSDEQDENGKEDQTRQKEVTFFDVGSEANTIDTSDDLITTKVCEGGAGIARY